MIAFGVPVTDVSAYERFALPAIRRVAEADSLILTRSGVSIQQAYNEMLDEAAASAELEAVVLLHQDIVIDQPDFNARLRSVLAEDEVGLVGVVGARGVSRIGWFEGTEPIGRIGALVFDDLLRLGWREPFEPYDVDAIDGSLIAFSPWAVRNLRFDMRFAESFFGYDSDISLQARACGKRVVVADLWLVHDSIGKIAERRGSWVRAAIEFDRKWGLQ
jgi:Glycosyltransferase like family